MRLWGFIWALACAPETPSPEPVPVAEPAPPVAPEFAPPTESRYAASHILVAWKGAVRAPDTVTRDREKARTEAQALREKIVSGTPFEALARDHSDGASAPRGGTLGVFLTGTMVPHFEAATASVAVGELAPVIETPFGFHVIRRDPVVQIRASHILVSWEGAWRSAQERTRNEATLRVAEARQRILGGTPFSEAAMQYSDDTTAGKGGDLGPVAPGQMIPAFEDAALSLSVGELSEVVETPYGFHLIQRTE